MAASFRTNSFVREVFKKKHHVGMRPTHRALNLHHCESNGKSGVMLLPERWGQQSNFFSKFLGRDSKASLMELFQWQPPNSSNSRTAPTLDHFSFEKKKKMAVMQPWLWFCTNMSFPLAFVKKRWNRIWTTGVATEILQLARLFFHVLTHTWTDCLNRQDLIYRCFNASICPLFSSWCFRRSWPWTGGFLSCLV